MKTDVKLYSVSDIVAGIECDGLESKGHFGLSGCLTIQPEHQLPLPPDPRSKRHPTRHTAHKKASPCRLEADADCEEAEGGQARVAEKAPSGDRATDLARS